MKVQEMIRLNNEKRKLLTEENETAYGDMLVYIRSNSNKSEQQTEEVLLELLDHLLEAQKEGKSAWDVFGDELSCYCDEIIAEIPAEKAGDHLKFYGYIALNFLGSAIFFTGAITAILYYFFDLGPGEFNIPVGSGLLALIAGLVIFFLFINYLIHWMKHLAFNKRKSWVDFLLLWFSIAIFLATFSIILLLSFKFVPPFGTTLTIPNLVLAVIGGLLYLVSFIMNKTFRIIS